jgi:hypothetical protein
LVVLLKQSYFQARQAGDFDLVIAFPVLVILQWLLRTVISLLLAARCRAGYGDVDLPPFRRSLLDTLPNNICADTETFQMSSATPL